MYKFDRNGSGFLIPLDAAEISGLVSGGNFFAAEVDGILAGCGSVVEYGIAELRSLAVKPEYHSHGIGSGLIEVCKEEAGRRGHTELYALIQQQSYGLFRRHGFAYKETPPQKLKRDCKKCPQHNHILLVYHRLKPVVCWRMGSGRH